MKSETHELGLLADDLDAADEEIVNQVKKVTSKTLLEIKKEAKQRVDSRGLPHLPRLAMSFGYDVTTTKDEVAGEVGASTQKGQGALDHLIENGSPTSEAIPHWAPAADRQVPLWHEFLDQAAVDAVERRRA